MTNDKVEMRKEEPPASDPAVAPEEPAETSSAAGEPESLASKYHGQSVAARVMEELSGISGRMERISEQIALAREQIGYLPPQLRNLGNRIDAAAASISETRYRALLKDMLGVYDFADQAVRVLESEVAEHGGPGLKYCRIIRTQLCQLLSLNGLTLIVAEGEFDPDNHKAVERKPCADPDQVGRIARIVRPGFRTEHQVLRYAEVVVFFYEPPTISEQAINRQSDSEPVPPEVEENRNDNTA